MSRPRRVSRGDQASSNATKTIIGAAPHGTQTGYILRPVSALPELVSKSETSKLSVRVLWKVVTSCIADGNPTATGSYTCRHGSVMQTHGPIPVVDIGCSSPWKPGPA